METDPQHTPLRESEVYLGAVRLLSKCASWIRDEKLRTDKDNPWSLYYAVDTDVIAMYLNPDSDLSSSPADVFGGQSRTASLLSRLLGDFLFRSEPPPVQMGTSSFLLISPHDEELYRMVLAIAREVATASDVTTKQFESLSQILEAYAHESDETKLVKRLEDHVPELAALYDANRGDRAALDRFAQLADDKFVNIDNFHLKGFAFPPTTGVGGVRLSILHEKSDRWLKLLRKYQRSKQPAYALLGDADVLATLEYLNAELADDKKRVLLITGSPYLYRAASEFVPAESNPDNKNFAYLYLRHPQWILAHPGFFEATAPIEGKAGVGGRSSATQRQQSGATFNLLDWLSIVFPERVQDNIHNREVVESIAVDEPEGQLIAGDDRLLGGKALSRIREEWASQIKIVALGKYANALDDPRAQGAEKLARMMRSMLERKRWSFQTFRATILEEAANSLSRIYFSAVWLGLWSSRGTPRERMNRAMPALRFDGNIVEVEAYRKSVMQLQLHSIGPDAPYVRALEEAKIELAKADPSLYHSHVIHAFAFGLRNRWDASFTLCRIAISIADALPSRDNELRRGREAAYLAAIACRRGATQLEDLARAKYYLRQAHNRENKGADPDVRFKSEDLAIQTREVYFRYYTGGETNVVAYARRIIQGLRDLRNEAKVPKNQDVRNWVLRQCYSNFLNLLFILRGLGKVENDSNEMLFLNEFQQLLQEESFLRDSEAELVCGVASVVLGTIPEAQREEKVARLLADIGLTKRIMPYDKKRMELFRRLIGESCV
ncbi:MAG TPA: hypothetical protein VNX26_06425 [Candidatus Acidoferrum sp.]|nr:hypothetical protein [Candidatus Acidoferrum sp.]